MTSLYYVREPGEIMRRSFAIIRAEADLSRLPGEAHGLALRMIHACGMTDIASDLVVSPGAAAAGRAALRAGVPILCDAQMVAAGITRQRLPADNPVRCDIGEPEVARNAATRGVSRASVAVEHWQSALGGAVVGIGNAPTALFRLIEGLADGWPMPALVVATPVGFVGAVEAKDALIASGFGVPHIVLKGRRGGSALAAAAINALAREEPEP